MKNNSINKWNYSINLWNIPFIYGIFHKFMELQFILFKKQLFYNK
jgi:hypothetical protein